MKRDTLPCLSYINSVTIYFQVSGKSRAENTNPNLKEDSSACGCNPTPANTPTSQKAGGDRLGTQKRKETKTPAIHRTTCYYYVRRRLLGKREKNRFCAMQRQPRLASCILSALCNSKSGGEKGTFKTFSNFPFPFTPTVCFNYSNSNKMSSKCFSFFLQ